jgi:hypothetical protein
MKILSEERQFELRDRALRFEGSSRIAASAVTQLVNYLVLLCRFKCTTIFDNAVFLLTVRGNAACGMSAPKSAANAEQKLTMFEPDTVGAKTSAARCRNAVLILSFTALSES